MNELKLYMLLLGGKPANRHTEQHDVFFAIGSSLKELVPAITAFWPEAEKLHVDAWRTVTVADGHAVTVMPRLMNAPAVNNQPRLFFLNLGGYKPNEFEEYHYKMITVAGDKGTAIAAAHRTAFYKHTGFLALLHT